MEENNQVIIYSWTRFKVEIKSLVEKIGRGNFNFIVAVSRGGLIPATYLSRALDIRQISVIALQSYKGRNRGDIVEYKMPWLEEKEVPLDIQKKMLIVEDIVDSGKTLEYLRKKLPLAKVASLVTKGRLDPDFFSSKENLWVRFPWE